jgi:hypothetical protein
LISTKVNILSFWHGVTGDRIIAGVLSGSFFSREQGVLDGNFYYIAQGGTMLLSPNAACVILKIMVVN